MLGGIAAGSAKSGQKEKQSDDSMVDVAVNSANSENASPSTSLRRPSAGRHGPWNMRLFMETLPIDSFPSLIFSYWVSRPTMSISTSTA
jgi:hypothetical protein